MSAEGETLAANLAVLARSQASLAALLGHQAPLPYELLRTPSGHATARFGGRLLHSAYDPRGEAARLVASSLPAGTDTALVLGAGLGYAVEEALGTPGVERVLVCEADPARLSTLLRARGLPGILGDGRLSWLVGGDPGAVLLALDGLGARLVGVVGQRSLESADEAWYGAVRAAVARFLAKEEINRNTLRRFGRLWVRNLARNAGRLAELPGIAGLEGLFAGLPALVVAAGPSLDEMLPRIGELRKRCLLVAVDTALRSLLASGVEPDILVAVDPQYWNWRHLADLAAPAALLVSEPAVWPPVLRALHRATFLASSLFPLGRALTGEGREGVEGRGLLGAGGSVATSAWDLARHLGAAPLYMAGLDLGYPEGQTHARASLFEQRALASGTRLRPASSSQAAALHAAPSLRVASNRGDPVLTDQRMSLYAWWFEARLARSGSPPTRSLSGGGVAIPGLPLVGLDELLALPPRRPEIDEALGRAASLRLSPEAAGAARAVRGELLTGMERVAALAGEGRVAAVQAQAALGAGIDFRGELAALEGVDAELHRSEARDVVGFLLPSLQDLVGSRPKDLGASLRSSEKLYKAIEDSARDQLAILEAAGPCA